MFQRAFIDVLLCLVLSTTWSVFAQTYQGSKPLQAIDVVCELISEEQNGNDSYLDSYSGQMRVSNIGEVSALSCTVQLIAIREGGKGSPIVVGKQDIGELKPGSSVTKDFLWSPKEPGKYSLCFIANTASDEEIFSNNKSGLVQLVVGNKNRTSELKIPEVFALGTNIEIESAINGLTKQEAIIQASLHSVETGETITVNSIDPLTRKEGVDSNSSIKFATSGLKPGEYEVRVDSSSGLITKKVSLVKPGETLAAPRGYIFPNPGLPGDLAEQNNKARLYAIIQASSPVDPSLWESLTELGVLRQAFLSGNGWVVEIPVGKVTAVAALDGVQSVSAFLPEDRLGGIPLRDRGVLDIDTEGKFLIQLTFFKSSNKSQMLAIASQIGKVVETGRDTVLVRAASQAIEDAAKTHPEIYRISYITQLEAEPGVGGIEVCEDGYTNKEYNFGLEEMWSHAPGGLSGNKTYAAIFDSEAMWVPNQDGRNDLTFWGPSEAGNNGQGRLFIIKPDPNPSADPVVLTTGLSNPSSNAHRTHVVHTVAGDSYISNHPEDLDTWGCYYWSNPGWLGDPNITATDTFFYQDPDIINCPNPCFFKATNPSRTTLRILDQGDIELVSTAYQPSTNSTKFLYELRNNGLTTHSMEVVLEVPPAYNVDTTNTIPAAFVVAPGGSFPNQRVFWSNLTVPAGDGTNPGKIALTLDLDMLVPRGYSIGTIDPYSGSLSRIDDIIIGPDTNYGCLTECVYGSSDEACECPQSPSSIPNISRPLNPIHPTNQSGRLLSILLRRWSHSAPNDAWRAPAYLAKTISASSGDLKNTSSKVDYLLHCLHHPYAPSDVFVSSTESRVIANSDQYASSIPNQQFFAKFTRGYEEFDQATSSTISHRPVLPVWLAHNDADNYQLNNNREIDWRNHDGTPYSKSRWGTIAWVSSGKASFTIGAVGESNPANRAHRSLSYNLSTEVNYSSRGPTHDGKIKPDVVAHTGIGGFRVDREFSFGSEKVIDYYGEVGGTSTATPQAASLILLILEHFNKKNGINHTVDANNIVTRSSIHTMSSTIKALISHNTKDGEVIYELERNPDGSLKRVWDPQAGLQRYVILAQDPIGPDYETGYGEVDAKNTLEFIDEDNQIGNMILEGELQATSQTQEYEILITDSNQPLRVTMSWDDLPEPDAPSDPAARELQMYQSQLIHDLDLVVISPPDGNGHRRHYYPWKLNYCADKDCSNLDVADYAVAAGLSLADYSSATTWDDVEYTELLFSETFGYNDDPQLADPTTYKNDKNLVLTEFLSVPAVINSQLDNDPNFAANHTNYRDDRNVIEQIRVENPMVGTWTVQVSSATGLVEPQKYSLVSDDCLAPVATVASCGVIYTGGLYDPHPSGIPLPASANRHVSCTPATGTHESDFIRITVPANEGVEFETFISDGAPAGIELYDTCGNLLSDPACVYNIHDPLVKWYNRTGETTDILVHFTRTVNSVGWSLTINCVDSPGSTRANAPEIECGETFGVAEMPGFASETFPCPASGAHPRTWAKATVPANTRASFTLEDNFDPGAGIAIYLPGQTVELDCDQQDALATVSYTNSTNLPVDLEILVEYPDDSEVWTLKMECEKPEASITTNGVVWSEDAGEVSVTIETSFPVDTPIAIPFTFSSLSTATSGGTDLALFGSYRSVHEDGDNTPHPWVRYSGTTGLPWSATTVYDTVRTTDVIDLQGANSRGHWFTKTHYSSNIWSATPGQVSYWVKSDDSDVIAPLIGFRIDTTPSPTTSFIEYISDSAAHEVKYDNLGWRYFIFHIGGESHDNTWHLVQRDLLADFNDLAAASGFSETFTNVRNVYAKPSPDARYDDLTMTTWEVVIPANQQSATLTVLINDDGLVEVQESVVIELLDGSDHDLAGSASTATNYIAASDRVVNDDRSAPLSINCGSSIVNQPITNLATESSSPAAPCHSSDLIPDVWYKFNTNSYSGTGPDVTIEFEDGRRYGLTTEPDHKGFIALYRDMNGVLTLVSSTCSRSGNKFQLMSTLLPSANYVVRVGSESDSPNKDFSLSCFSKI
jgi:hypothetical protein